MDLIKMDYHDYLATVAGCVSSISSWLLHDWEHDVISFHRQTRYSKEKLHWADVCFSINDEHIELYDGIYENEPYTDIKNSVSGCLITLFLKATMVVKNGKIKGKMCIRSPSKLPIRTEYVLNLYNTNMHMTNGLGIYGDGIGYNHCRYEYTETDILLQYKDGSEMKSIFDKIKDINQKKLLERFLLECITKDLEPAIEDWHHCQLSIKLLASELCGNDYSLRNVLRIHNKKLHAAFNILVNKIIKETNNLIAHSEKSIRMKIDKIFGLSKQEDGEKTLGGYKGYIDNLYTLRIVDKGKDNNEKDVIVSYKGDLVTLHAEFEYENLNFYFKPVDDKTGEADSTFNQTQHFKTEGAHFVITLKKLSQDKVEIKLDRFRILYIKPVSDYQVNMAMDYSVSSAMEEILKPFLEEALKSDDLHELAINPEIELEYDPGVDFNTEDSEYEQ